MPRRAHLQPECNIIDLSTPLEVRVQFERLHLAEIDVIRRMFASSTGVSRFRAIARRRPAMIRSALATMLADALAFRRGQQSRARAALRCDVVVRQIDVLGQIDRFVVQFQVREAARESSMHDA